MKDVSATAWNPGLESTIPAAYRHLETLFARTHTLTSYDEIAEMRDVTGMEAERLVMFRAGRLAQHALLVRMMARLSFDQGHEYTDLGVNFRETARQITERYITPILPQLDAQLSERYMQYMRDAHAAYKSIRDEQEQSLRPPAGPQRGFLSRLFFGANKQAPSVPRLDAYQRTQDMLARIKAREAQAIANEALMYRFMGEILGRAAGRAQGGASLSPAFLAKMVAGQMHGCLGTALVDGRVNTLFEVAIADMGLRALPVQDAPIVLSLKGASASGKSSQRDLLRARMQAQGHDWRDFALITPDIFRKDLLDYDSLGEAYKYAGALTGRELAIIDSKLDAYIAKGLDRRGGMPHMMIDRFRRDTFSSENQSHPFVSRAARLDMFFIVTAPENIVERGWLRGLQVGRYKAVPDFLDHSVEAHQGLRSLLFKWMGEQAQPQYGFEILNNNVPKGTPPLCAARGDSGVIDIFDIATLLDIERYGKINIAARSAADLYPDPAALAPARNLALIEACAARIGTMRFVDAETGRIYAQYARGAFQVMHKGLYQAQCRHADAQAVFACLGAQKAPAFAPALK